MRTRCPQCNTIFRVTPEQLRFRAGKVRCGHCQAIFNALDTLIEEAPTPPPPPVAPPTPPVLPEPPAFAEAVPPAEPEPAAAPTEPPVEPEPSPEPAESVPAYPEEETQPESAFVPSEAPPAEAIPAAEPPEETPHDETPEESTQAAREAGLVAARELAEAPGYNRWAAGTLASSPLAGLEGEGRHRVTWPFTLAAVLLVLALATQLAYHFRTEIAQRSPDAAALFTALGADIPLPHEAGLVSIEASDLQADAARGLLVLQATLKNRAPYAQAWPALELTLTDTHDAVVARRVLYAADYLPPGVDQTAFAANGETALRLWIEAKDVAAAGYRLYVFYP